ncbi:glycosyltransferase family 2 protein [Pontibacter chitinilyticus]|uniref:glycosyltransferase family 2 protein n=1 Tax=Pontibacter chitinilyticus TaxID=2674989 RepID=UPI0032192AE1
MLDTTNVYIVLVNYKGWQETIECLESLFKLAYPHFKVVVVDNGSQDSSIDQLKRWADGTLPLPNINTSFYTKTSLDASYVKKPVPYNLVADTEASGPAAYEHRLLFIPAPTNIGFAGGNNLGIKLALAQGADYIWLLNNDTVVSKDSLLNLVEYFEKAKLNKEPLGILGAKLVYYHNPNLVQAILGRYNPFLGTTAHVGLNCDACTSFADLEIRRNDYIVGASMFVSAEFVQNVGLMSEEYFLYFEEIDWVKRGEEKGYQIGVCHKAVVYHKEGAAIGGGMKDNSNKSELSDFYSIRNRLLVTKKFYRKYLLPVYLSLIFVAINRIRRKQYDRLSLIYKALKSSFRKTT